MHAYPLAVLRLQMRDIRSPADLGHIERGMLHESAFVTRAEPPYLYRVTPQGGSAWALRMSRPS
jgi:hypothetical protein